MVNEARKIAYLDGIRGIAALLVFFHHFLLVFYISYYVWDVNAVHLNGWEIWYGQSVFSVFSNGNFCVNIFFVLSGYVLSRKYFQTFTPELLISGAQRRFVRIYIPVAFTLVLSYILIKANLYNNVAVSHITITESWFGSMWNFPNPFEKLCSSLVYGTMFMGDNSLDTTLWTMSIEFYGSLFVFAFLALTHNTKNRLSMLMLVFLYCCFTDSERLATFVLGISLNYFEHSGLGAKKIVNTLIAPLLLIISLVLGSYPPNTPSAGTFFYNTPASLLAYSGWVHVIGGLLLILSFVLSANMQKLISSRVFRFLGYISFSLYLLHPLILGTFSSFVFLKLYTHWGYNHSVAIVFILTLGILLASSWLMAKYIDANGIKLANYLYQRFVKKTNKA
jgi:peptidoglycan/LPS O-acetylase OafA/YrhL